ncbi:MAG: S9 family peptidase, partial [Proteiniphilum sp.]
MSSIKQVGVLLAIVMTTMSVKAQSIAGDWKGTLSVQGVDLELVFHLVGENGNLTGTMDVPMQGATGIPVDVIEQTGNELKLGVSAAQITYNGVLQGDNITGNYEQAGMILPLTLKRFESKLPGNPELASSDEELQALIAHDEGDYTYSVADYFARPNASSFQLSPNGKYLSYMEKDGLKNHVYTKELATGEVVRAIEEKEEPIKGYGWVNDDRLFYAMDHGGNENYHIYAANIDGSNALDLTPFDGVRAGIISLLKEQKDYIIISMNKDNPQIFEPYKLNVVTGELEKLYENSDPANPIQGYDFDKDGNLRAYTKMVNGIEMEFYYKNLDTDEFELKKKTNWDDSFSIISFNYNTPDPDDAYVVTNL